MSKRLWIASIVALVTVGRPAAAHACDSWFDIGFRPGSASLSPLDRQGLTSLARMYEDLEQGGKTMRVKITASTDRVGSAAGNLRLARRRAKAVQSELERNGIPHYRINILGLGESRPRVGTADGMPHRANRYARIELSESCG